MIRRALRYINWRAWQVIALPLLVLATGLSRTAKGLRHVAVALRPDPVARLLFQTLLEKNEERARVLAGELSREIDKLKKSRD